MEPIRTMIGARNALYMLPALQTGKRYSEGSHTYTPNSKNTSDSADKDILLIYGTRASLSVVVMLRFGR